MAVGLMFFFLLLRFAGDLHSFPTRRSSDLFVALLAGEPGIGKTRLAYELGKTARSRRATVVRSEEHTSELQSQSNLVCRLLLEKKKHRSQCSTAPWSVAYSRLCFTSVSCTT